MPPSMRVSAGRLTHSRRKGNASAKVGRSQNIQGNRAMTGDTALRLGQCCGTGPAFWMSLQSLHDVRRAAAVPRDRCRIPRPDAAVI
jgi:plasmid maintenance system antidote protein VapI